jgi:hypothetical protein
MMKKKLFEAMAYFERIQKQKSRAGQIGQIMNT